MRVRSTTMMRRFRPFGDKREISRVLLIERQPIVRSGCRRMAVRSGLSKASAGGLVVGHPFA